MNDTFRTRAVRKPSDRYDFKRLPVAGAGKRKGKTMRRVLYAFIGLMVVFAILLLEHFG